MRRPSKTLNVIRIACRLGASQEKHGYTTLLLSLDSVQRIIMTSGADCSLETIQYGARQSVQGVIFTGILDLQAEAIDRKVQPFPSASVTAFRLPSPEALSTAS